MRIVVPIKQILDPAGVLVRADKERIFINREEYIISPGDKNALEAALQVKDALDAEVVAISLGPPRADDALREALAMGADAAYLLSDKAVFKDADVSATARVLAAAVDKIGGVDMVIAGQRSADTGIGQVGPRLAELLGMAQVTDVWALAVDESTVRATRRWGDGFAAVEAPLPALVTMAEGSNKPRLPHGARIMSAYREGNVTTWGAADLGLDAAALRPLIVYRGQSFPPPPETGEMLRGDPAQVAQELVQTLKLQKLI